MKDYERMLGEYDLLLQDGVLICARIARGDVLRGVLVENMTREDYISEFESQVRRRAKEIERRQFRF